MKMIMREIIYIEIISRITREQEIEYEDEGRYTIRRDEGKKKIEVYEGVKNCFIIEYGEGIVYKDGKEKRKICQEGYWYVDEGCEYRCKEKKDCSNAQRKELLLIDNCLKKCPSDNYYQDYNIRIKGNINDDGNKWVLKNNEKSFTNILKRLCKNLIAGGHRGDWKGIEEENRENSEGGRGGESRRIKESPCYTERGECICSGAYPRIA